MKQDNDLITKNNKTLGMETNRRNVENIEFNLFFHPAH